MPSTLPAFSPGHRRTHTGSDPSPSRSPMVSVLSPHGGTRPHVAASADPDATDITSGFFAAWGRDYKETRPYRDLCYAMILQTAQDIVAVNRQRRWLEAQEEAYYWCEHPQEGTLSLAACVEVLFPDALAHFSPHDFGRSIIQSAERIASLEFPNSNMPTAKDSSPEDFLQKMFGRKQKESSSS